MSNNASSDVTVCFHLNSLIALCPETGWREFKGQTMDFGAQQAASLRLIEAYMCNCTAVSHPLSLVREYRTEKRTCNPKS